MDFICVQSDAVRLTRLREALLMAKVSKTHKFISKLYIRTVFPEKPEIISVRKNGRKTTLYRSPDCVQVYEYEDNKKVVRGYIDIDMNLRFVSLPKSDLPRYPLRVSDGETIETSPEELQQFFETVIYEATHEYDIYGSRHIGPLFAYEHLERFRKNYGPAKRQEFFDHIRRLFKRQKPKKTTN